jgi:large repetitive protein
VTGDRVAELAETFVVNLSAPTGARIADGQGVGTIGDDEPYLSIADLSAPEGNGGPTPFTFTMTLSAASEADVTVSYSTTDGTAVAGSDYVALAAGSSVTIGAGTLSQTVAVWVNGDAVREGDETFVVNLSAPINAGIADGQGLGTVLDDEPRLRIGDASVWEGDAGTTQMTFTVSLWPNSTETVTVHYTTNDFVAVAGSDYEFQSGTLTFLAGESTRTIDVTVNGDLDEEFDESFTVSLDNATGADIDVSHAWGTILTEEAPPYLWIDSTSGGEGPYGSIWLVFNVWLTAPSEGGVFVNYTTIDGSASVEDYEGQSGTLYFAPGEMVQTIWVYIFDDYQPEADEQFYVQLSNGSVPILGDLGTGTIYDDDWWW